MPTRDFQWIQRTTTVVRAAWTLLFFALFSIDSPRLRIQASGIGQSSDSAITGMDSDLNLWPIPIDYPEDGSIFPPGITPPTFLWRDAAGASWSIDISFADNTSPIHARSKGERMRIGAIDQDCVRNTDDLPRLTPRLGPGLQTQPPGPPSNHIQPSGRRRLQSPAIETARFLSPAPVCPSLPRRIRSARLFFTAMFH